MITLKGGKKLRIEWANGEEFNFTDYIRGRLARYGDNKEAVKFLKEDLLSTIPELGFEIKEKSVTKKE